MKPADAEELKSMMGRYGSPEKHSRVDGYMGSDGVKATLSYLDNDISYGLANNSKPNKAIFSPAALKKETWKPKTSLRWHENKG